MVARRQWDRGSEAGRGPRVGRYHIQRRLKGKVGIGYVGEDPAVVPNVRESVEAVRPEDVGNNITDENGMRDAPHGTASRQAGESPAKKERVSRGGVILDQ